MQLQKAFKLIVKIQWCRCHALYNPYSFKYYSLICIWYMHEFDAIDFQTKQDWNWFLTNFFMVCSTKALLTSTISTQSNEKVHVQRLW